MPLPDDVGDGISGDGRLRLAVGGAPEDADAADTDVGDIVAADLGCTAWSNDPDPRDVTALEGRWGTSLGRDVVAGDAGTGKGEHRFVGKIKERRVRNRGAASSR